MENEIEQTKPLERDGMCFTGDTKVHTDFGTMEIEHIDAGTMVLSRNVATGAQGYRKVLKKFERDDVKIYHVFYEAEIGHVGVVSTTAEHPFWVNGKGWVKAVDLKPGDELEICDPKANKRDFFFRYDKPDVVGLGGGRWQAKVLYVDDAEFDNPVYNLEVEEFHTYFVGDFGILVHNTCWEYGESIETPHLDYRYHQAGMGR